MDDEGFINKEAPSTFIIPSLKDSNDLSIEKMWVKVKGKEGKKYSGIIDNDPGWRYSYI